MKMTPKYVTWKYFGEIDLLTDASHMTNESMSNLMSHYYESSVISGLTISRNGSNFPFNAENKEVIPSWASVGPTIRNQKWKLIMRRRRFA